MLHLLYTYWVKGRGRKEGIFKCFIQRRTHHILFTAILRRTIVHITAFVTPDVEDWLEREILVEGKSGNRNNQNEQSYFN